MKNLITVYTNLCHQISSSIAQPTSYFHCLF